MEKSSSKGKSQKNSNANPNNNTRTRRRQENKPHRREKPKGFVEERPNEPRKKKYSGNVGAKKSKPKPCVFYEDFTKFASEQRSNKFKVHLPDCNCVKFKNMKKILRESGVVIEDDHGGLMIISDASTTDSIYIHKDNTSNSLKQIETDLKNKLFPSGENGNSQEQTNEKKIKVSCACCLLHKEPNGFVAFYSSSLLMMLDMKKLVDKRIMEKKSSNSLHHDHAHSVGILRRDALWNLSFYTKMKNIEKAAFYRALILKELGKQQIFIKTNQDYKIKFGHHLDWILRLTCSKTSYSRLYFFVIIYFDPGFTLCLDVSGGKRHLGENSWQCARRETEEEMSIDFDEHTKVTETLSDTKSSENVYYVINIKNLTNVNSSIYRLTKETNDKLKL